MATGLVLLHGFTHTGASWQPVIAGVSERYRPLAPDIRGHGGASAREPVELDAVIADIEALARRASRSPAIRWAAGSPCMWRWRCLRAWRRWC